MQSRITIDGYTFKYNEENKEYECRGGIEYDDEGDEVPEERLWKAAEKLERQLREQGHNANCDFSEKGWVEVTLH